MPTTVRPYHAGDLDAVYEVAIRVGDAGSDARELYPDPRIVPEIFTGPYLVLEPDLAFVADQDGRAVGYIVGTADTAHYVRRYRAHWLPNLVDRYPAPTDSPSTPADQMAFLLHHPETMLREEVAEYPAHLHINLLPEAQGGGHGRELMRRFIAALHRRGVPGVHLGVAVRNTNAIAFYHRLGFYEIPTPDRDHVLFLGRDTEPL